MNKIRIHRLTHNLTQSELASTIGVSTRTISRWESNYCQPNGQNLQSLARALGCNPADLVPPVVTLSEARRIVGLSQQQLAAIVGIPAGSISNVETGRLPLGNPERWAEALGRSPQEIIVMAHQAATDRYQANLGLRP